MSAASFAPRPPLAGVARKFHPAPTLRSLLAAELRVVAEGSFRPRGGRYDVRPLRMRPVRALRGGPDGIVAAYSLAQATVEIRILTRAQTITGDDIAWAMDRARGMAAVDDDPSEFLAMVHLHPLVAELASRFDCRIDRTPTVFEAFTRAVIEQLVTTFEARASIRRLFWAAGELVDGTFVRAAPTARAVLEVPPWKLHAMGIGSRRSRTLREGARRAASRGRGIPDSPPPSSPAPRAASIPQNASCCAKSLS